MATRTVRQNYLAIVVAGLAYFVLQAIWFTLFMDRWLEGIGRTRQYLMGSGVSPAFQYGAAFLSAIVMAVAISCVTQLTGEQTAARGAQNGALLWLGFVATTWGTEYSFEVRSPMTFFINTGVALIGMTMMGLIVGGWRSRKA